MTSPRAKLIRPPWLQRIVEFVLLIACVAAAYAILIPGFRLHARFALAIANARANGELTRTSRTWIGGGGEDGPNIWRNDFVFRVPGGQELMARSYSLGRKYDPSLDSRVERSAQRIYSIDYPTARPIVPVVYSPLAPSLARIETDSPGPLPPHWWLLLSFPLVTAGAVCQQWHRRKGKAVRS